ncbi:hypothetical protein L6164_035830 [Bauhinia variegata]|uniref:Uncharacterized protein n=1 Tax=Bauhinia variegata TaxID=167791 RepID=A0ACB9KF88_BAUVA|nr:hypothetical protein L6164_035830 [Bauhinia variegata]
MHGQFSIKSDMYSFGVVILEIIMGRKNTSFQKSGYADLLSYAWKKWRDGNSLELLNTSLRDSSYSKEEVTRCIHIGLRCVEEDPAQRATMQTISVMLNSHSVTLAMPQRPVILLMAEAMGALSVKI